MQLPAELRSAISARLEAMDRPALASAAEQISKRYRGRDFGAPVIGSAAERMAYALTRMPATYAANRHVFAHIREVAGSMTFNSLLDLGAGTGAASWAAVEEFPDFKEVSLIERDAGLIDMGRAFAAGCESEPLRAGHWTQGDLASYLPTPHDLIVVSYALGELTPKAAERLVAGAWKDAGKMLVLVEPGSVEGFKSILAARRFLLDSGADLVAPCPHHDACPMAEAGDWCHFAQRVERTAEHRRLKGAELGYEDEKFSYVAAAKLPAQRPGARVVRHPLIRAGHVQLTLCTGEGLKRETVGKSQRERYKAARKAYWGSAWG